MWRFGREGDWKCRGVTGEEDVSDDDDGDDNEAPGGHSTGLDTITAGHRHRIRKLLITWNMNDNVWWHWYVWSVWLTCIVLVTSGHTCVDYWRVHQQLSKVTTWLHWSGRSQLASHCFQDTCSTQYTTTTRVHGWLFKYFSCYGCYFL